MPRSSGEREQGSKPGSDFLQLDLSGVPSGGRTDRLTDRLRAAVTTGELAVGSTLPPTRHLAADLGVTRGMVTEAYRRLTDEGLVVGDGRRGTRVVAAPSAPRTEASPAPTTPERTRTFDPAATTAAFEWLRSQPAELDLSPGVPDLAAFPRAAWLRAERSVLTSTPHHELGYGAAQGAPRLRAALAGWLARYRGLVCSPDELVVVAGVAQAFALLAGLLRADGVDAVAVEDPGSSGARRQLQAHGLSTVPVPVDERGLDVAALQRSGASVVMTTPAHQFPTGVVLDGARRRELVAWADAGGLVVEDDYDAEHRFDRAPVPALAASARSHVYYAGSVSKLMAPALRIGWVLAPPALHPRVVALKRDTDLGNPVLPQLVLAALMEDGTLARHLRSVRTRHRRRRDAVVAAVRRELPAVSVHGAAAGLHLTVTLEPSDRALPPGADLAWAQRCLDAGVKVHPLSWHRTAPGPPGLVIGYAATTASALDDAVGRIASALPSPP